MKRKTVENIEIVDIGAKGKVIGKKEGLAYLLNGAVPGDTVTATIGRKRKGMLTGFIDEITTFSEERTEPRCHHFDHCGGCNWQNLNYDAQVRFKDQQVTNQLRRIGSIEAQEVLPIQTADEIYNYRNKLEFTFTNQRWLRPDEISSGEDIPDRRALGFHVPGRFDWVMQIDQCHLEPEIHNDIRNTVFDTAKTLDLSFYNLKDKHGIMRNLVLRRNNAGDWMLVLIASEDSKTVRNLLEAVNDKFEMIRSVWLIVNTKVNDDFSDCPMVHIHGTKTIVETFHNSATGESTSYNIGPKSFFQTNAAQAQKLYQRVFDWADISPEDNVYDLYTGTGSIALYMARQAKKVVGIEYIEEAVADARLNAEMNSVDNCEFFAGDMKDILTKDFIAEHGAPDVLITDPPRAGMHKDVVLQILEVEPKRIVYVSCDPATQARDLDILSEKYDVVKSQAFDLFPHTSHVENVVRLERK